MRELLELNRYVHDFTSAMWFCGSILMFLMVREARRLDASVEAGRAVLRVAGRIGYLTVPSLLITLVSGGVRAVTFTTYEYVGEVTSALVAILVVKHVLFAAIVTWGIWVHVTRRKLGMTARGPAPAPA